MLILFCVYMTVLRVRVRVRHHVIIYISLLQIFSKTVFNICRYLWRCCEWFINTTQNSLYKFKCIYRSWGGLLHM